MKDYKVGFFILADEEPTINRSRFIALCEELIERNLGVHWGINTRVTDVLRDEELLPLYRKAGLVHVSLGTEAAAQLNLNLFRKETTIEDNKRAVQLLKKNGIVAEAQFIMGLENETPETIEETYRMALDWKPDMVNWNMFTPWPFSDLLELIPVDLAIAPMILSDMDGVTFTQKVRQLQAEDEELTFKVLLRCSLQSEEQVMAAFAAGAEAYLNALRTG